MHTAFPCSTIACSARAHVTRGGDYEYNCDDEIENLHELVKCRHLVLEHEDERSSDEAAKPRTEKGTQSASMKEAFCDPLWFFAIEMRLRHPDNTIRCLASSPIAPITAAIAEVAFEVAPVAA
jgi:hypothetical protein